MPHIPTNLLIPLLLIIFEASAISADNACTFHIGGKLFSLALMQQPQPYSYFINQTHTIQHNFCTTFIPSQCQQPPAPPKPQNSTITTNSTSTSPSSSSSSSSSSSLSQTSSPIRPAYSFLIISTTNSSINPDTNQTNYTTTYTCTRYSSSSYIYFFEARYLKYDNWGVLDYRQETQDTLQLTPEGKKRQTYLQIQCDDQILNFDEYEVNSSTIRIRAKSKYGCPVFEVSNLWSVFSDNLIVIGVVMIFLGAHLLFFGRSAIQTTIFITSFLLIFAVLVSIGTVFITPYSATLTIYLSFLIILFMSTLLSYGMTKLVNISLFFVGAILGFVVGMLINSIFCKIVGIYSVWSLVVFQIIFVVGFGVLGFKWRDYIIIGSSSVTGAYMLIRPISWLIGGFPNQLLLYHLIQTKQLNNLPWYFFLYITLMLSVAILGAMYQLIKLYRQNPEQQMQINFIQEAIEQPIDSIKGKVDQLIQKFKGDHNGEPEDGYFKMSQLAETEGRKRQGREGREGREEGSGIGSSGLYEAIGENIQGKTGELIGINAGVNIGNRKSEGKQEQIIKQSKIQPKPSTTTTTNPTN